MANYAGMFTHPMTVLGAGMMSGADPRREGLGGFGYGLLNTGEIMRNQAQLELENERAREMADLQAKTYQAQIAKNQAAQEAQAQSLAARERFAATPGLDPMQAAAIRAGHGQQVVPSLLAVPETPEPYSEIGQINEDIRRGFITSETGERLKSGLIDPQSPETFKEDWAAYKDVRKQEAPYVEVANRARQIMAAVENPGGFSDVTLVSNIAKFLDPGSVVRPSETEAINEAGGIVNSIQGMLQNAAGKGFIAPAQRKQIRAMMKRLTDIYDKEYTARRAQMSAFMKRRGRAEDIMGTSIEFPDFEEFPDSEKNTPPETQTIRGRKVRGPRNGDL